MEPLPDIHAAAASQGAPSPPPAPGSGRRTRVAVVTTVHRWGDPRIFERETAAWLEWDCEVHVFVPAAAAPERHGWSASTSLSVHVLPPPRGRAARMALALGIGGRVARHGPFDIVHFHDPELVPAMAALAARWFGRYVAAPPDGQPDEAPAASHRGE